MMPTAEQTGDSPLEMNSNCLVYACVFFQRDYLKLFELLLKTYLLFDRQPSQNSMLVLCDPNYETEIKILARRFDTQIDTWCLDLKTKFGAAYSRLFIFDYPDIDKYQKILYLDCDILLTNELSQITCLPLQDKLYALREGRTSRNLWGAEFFPEQHNEPAFSTGILLFNNCSKIRALFAAILAHISSHLAAGRPVPRMLDQPFVVYQAFARELYDNTALTGVVVNNPDAWNGETLSHFPGMPGSYTNKLEKMTGYLDKVFFNRRAKKDDVSAQNCCLQGKRYHWNETEVVFMPDGKINTRGMGRYSAVEGGLIRAAFDEHVYLLRFDPAADAVIALRQGDLALFKGVRVD